MADPASQEKAEKYKEDGNVALREDRLQDAVELYTKALELNQDAVYYSNRSAAYCKLEKYDEALDDAEKCIETKHTWIKGWIRKATALSFLNRYEEAKIAYDEGLKIDPNNETCKKGSEEADSKLKGPFGSQEINNPFARPDAIEKLRANPETRKYLDDPMFMTQLKLAQMNPMAMSNISDQRMFKCLGVLLGVDFFHMGDEDLPNGQSEPAQETNDEKPTSQNSSNKPEQKTETPSSKPEPSSNSSDSNTQKSDTKTKPLSKENDSKAKAAKEKGNAAYKSKNFDEALKHYDEAISLDPADMTYLNNKAAVYFEKGEYDTCIETCNTAVDVGRENRANFTIIAKALARAGKAYQKKGDEENALKFLNKSLSEHRAPDVAKLANEVQKQMKEKERLAYINPEVSLEEKNKGNTLFQQGKYPEALKHYNEAIKRNPEDAKLYSNRAACYTKLMEFNLALKDCDDCVRIDPKFVKGYLRKGAIYTAMKESTKAAHAYQKAMEMDPNCKEAQDGYRNAVVSESNDPEAVRKRAMADPEIQDIMKDPAMRLILEQMQKDPNALREHLKNPDVASKIEKLLEAGIIAIR